MFFDAVKSAWLVLASRIQGVQLIKGFVLNFELSLNVNLIVGRGLNYNKSETHLSLKVFYYFITAEHAPS